MRKCVAKWLYKDRAGHVVGHVCRFERGHFKEASKPSKEIIPYFVKEGNSFKAGLPESFKEKRPLYGLETIRDPLKPIYIVEGEKCASALKDLGFQVITSLGGCASAKQACWHELSNVREVVLLPDHDDVGQKYMRTVYRCLQDLSPSIEFSIVELPDLPIAGDICDFLTNSYSELYNWNAIASLSDHPFKHSIAQSLKNDFKAYRKIIPTEWQAIESSKGLKAISYKALNSIILPEREVVLSPWLNQRSINMVFADRGIGKTYFCLSCAITLAEGSAFIKYEAPRPVKVLYLDGEMQACLMRQRLRGLIKNEQLVNENLFIITPDCQNDRDMPNLAKGDSLEEIDEIISQIEPEVIFVDNLSTFIRSGHENEGESWLPVQEWAIRHRSVGRSLVFVHHTNKDGGQRGSSRKEDVMDVVIRLKRPDDYINDQEGARFEIHFTKARNLYGENIKPIEAVLEEQNGKQQWSWKSADGDYGQAIELLKSGYSQKEVCDELNIPKGTMSRWRQKAQSEGLL